MGYVPGGQIEIIGIDPQLGAIPYIFNLPKAQDTTHPKIYRSKRCMNCHASKDMGGAPGLLIGSVIPGSGGGTIDAFRRNIIGHNIPFAKRFGGWHITGENPFPQSWANQTGMMKSGQIHKIFNPPGKYFTWDNYPVQGSSLIPHLLLEHHLDSPIFASSQLINSESSMTQRKISFKSRPICFFPLSYLERRRPWPKAKLIKKPDMSWTLKDCCPVRVGKILLNSLTWSLEFLI